MSTGKSDVYGAILEPAQYFQRPAGSNKFLIIGAVVTVALLIVGLVLMGINKGQLDKIEQDLQLLQLQQLVQNAEKTSGNGTGTGELADEINEYEEDLAGGAKGKKKWGKLCMKRSNNCGQFKNCCAMHCQRYFWKCNEFNSVFSQHICKCT